jgi:hypothetical protein
MNVSLCFRFENPSRAGGHRQEAYCVQRRRRFGVLQPLQAAFIYLTRSQSRVDVSQRLLVPLIWFLTSGTLCKLSSSTLPAMNNLFAKTGWRSSPKYAAIGSPAESTESRAFLDEPGKEEVERASSEEDFGRRQSQRSSQRSRWMVGGLVTALIALNCMIASAYVLKKVPDEVCSEQLTGYCKSTRVPQHC